MALTREQAWELLNEYNKGEFHLKHGQIVGDVMRWYANELGYGDEADFWETVGLLHDLDFEMYPDEHCIKSQEIMREKGLDERLIRATASHGYGLHFDGSLARMVSFFSRNEDISVKEMDEILEIMRNAKK